MRLPANRRHLNLARINSRSSDYLPEAPLKNCQPRRQWNPVALAFLGDALWALYVRRFEFYEPYNNLASMHEASSLATRGEKQVTPAMCRSFYYLFIQAEVYEQLQVDKFLTDEERDVLRWGRNANKTSSPKRSSTLTMQDYRKATALECLVSNRPQPSIPSQIY